MKPWSEAELNYMRVPATPLLVVTASEESLHEPARQMVPHPPLPCLWPPRRGPHCDPQSEGAPLPMQTLQTDLHRDKGYCPLPVTQAQVADDRGSDVAGLRLPGASRCRRLPWVLTSLQTASVDTCRPKAKLPVGRRCDVP